MNTAAATRRATAERASLRAWERADAWRYAGHALELAREAATARARYAGARAVHAADADALAQAAQRAERLLASFDAWRLHLLAFACPNLCAASPQDLSAASLVADVAAWRVVGVWKSRGPVAAGEALRAEARHLLNGDGEERAENDG